MAIYYARANGNVNATNVWSTTPTGATSDLFPSFTNQDTLVANNFTVTLNVNTTVLEIRNDTTGGATAGGGFTLNGGVTLIANIYAAGTCVTYSSATLSIIVGNIYGCTSSNVWSISASVGTLNIVGNFYGTSAGNSGCLSNSTATINITGTIFGGSGSNSPTIQINNSGTINITGNIIGGSGGGNPTSSGVLNSSVSGTVNITGNVLGGTGGGAVGVLITNAGTINIVGTATGGSSGPGANSTGTGTLVVTRAKGNGFGNGSVGVNSIVGVSASQNGATKVYEIEYGPLGQSPTSGPIEMISANSNVAVFAVRLSTPKTLVDLNNAANLVPSSGNVRNGVSYNYGNNTGSCVIPNPNSVVYGVPVDNTVGSGLLSPVAVWNALTSSIGTSGSIGERLNNCSTVATVGKQLEGVL